MKIMVPAQTSQYLLSVAEQTVTFSFSIVFTLSGTVSNLLYRNHSPALQTN